MQTHSHHDGRMGTIRPLARASSTLLALALLGACSSNEPPSSLLPVGPQTPTTANVVPARYPPASMPARWFAALNRYRTQCGFPAYIENLTLDQAAQAHAEYLALNDFQAPDLESATGKRFVGETYAKRAAHFGFPVGMAGVGGVANVAHSTRERSEVESADDLFNGWISGVYHAWIVASPLTELGAGWTQTIIHGTQYALGNLTVSDLQPMTGDLPLTFPCEGTTGVPYAARGEQPEPPHTHGIWGAPIAVSGNPLDIVRLTSGSMQDAAGHPVALELLDTSNDATHDILKYMAVAYPPEALQPDASYTVTLTGTVNGVKFVRHFTFRTGATTG
jgi:uncharacterized protein YkwD